MRILLAAPDDGHSSLYVKRAFEQLGHKVTHFDYRAFPGATNIELLRLQNTHDLTLILKGEVFEPATLKMIHPCALWNFDCLTEDAMVLTREGLKPYQELRLGDIIYSYDYEKGRLVEDVIRAIPIYDVVDQEMVKVESKTNRMVLTPNHRVLLSSGSLWRYQTADALPSHFEVPVAAEYRCGQQSGLTSDQIKLLAWAITEGQMVPDHYQEVKSGPRIGTLVHIRATIRITQSSTNEEKATRIKEILDRQGIRYSVSTYGPRMIRGYKGKIYQQAKAYTFILNADDAYPYLQILESEKRIPRILLNATKEEEELLLAEMVLGDGSTKVRGNPVYCTSDLELALQVLELAFKAGFSPGLSRESHGWKIRLSTRKVGSFGPSNIERIKYTGKIFCLTTYTGNFIAFQGKRLFITGNCWYANELWLQAQVEAVDYFFTPSKGVFPRGIYLPEAADLELHRPGMYQKVCAADVTFIGTVKDVPGRDEWLEAIGNWCDDHKKVLRVWGSFPGELSKKWHTGMRAADINSQQKVIIGSLPYESEDRVHNDIVASSKVILDRQRNPEIEGAISARVFRTMAAKGLVVMKHCKDQEELLGLRNGWNCLTFEKDEETIPLIEATLGAEDRYRKLGIAEAQNLTIDERGVFNERGIQVDQRAVIARHGYETVEARHQWVDRAQKILDTVKL